MVEIKSNRARILEALTVGIVLGLAVGLAWAPVFSGLTFLPVDLWNSLYKPFALDGGPFHPHNHFDEDILKFYYLYEKMASENLWSPRWISEIFGGIPLYANTYASHFSPWKWLHLIFPVAEAYQWRLLISVWVAGMGMYWLVRVSGARRTAGLFAALAYMFAGIFTGLILRWWLHAPFSWVPFVAGCLYLWLVRRKNIWALGVPFFLALSFLDGFLQSSAAIVLAMGSLALFFCFRERERREYLGLVAGLVATFFFAFLMSGVSWLPQLEYLWWDMAKGESRMGGTVFGKNLLERALTLPAMFSMFFPEILGSVRALDLSKLIRSHLQDFNPFAGTSTAILFVAGCIGWRRSGSALLAAIFLALLGFIVPWLTPLDRFFYFRFLAVFVFGAAWAAGLVLSNILDGDEWWVRIVARTATWVAAALLLVFLSCGLVRVVRWARPGLLEASINEYVTARISQSVIGARNPEWMLGRGAAALDHWSLNSAGFLIPFTLAMIAALILGRSARWKVPATIVVVFLQAAWGIRAWHGFHDKALIYPDNELVQVLREVNPQNRYRVHINNFHGPQGSRLILPENANAVYEYATLEGFEGLRPRVIYDLPFDSKDAKSLARLGVGFVVTNPEPALREPGFSLVHRGRLAIYRVSGVEERAVFALPDGGSVKYLGERPNHMAFQVSSLHGGVVERKETYYPGWKAVWNGSEILPVFRVKDVFQGVRVPAGSGTLEFVFDPVVARWGQALSIGTTILWLLLLVTWCVRARPRANL